MNKKRKEKNIRRSKVRRMQEWKKRREDNERFMRQVCVGSGGRRGRRRERGVDGRGIGIGR